MSDAEQIEDASDSDTGRKTCDERKSQEEEGSSARPQPLPTALNSVSQDRSPPQKRRRYEGWDGDGMRGYMRAKNQKLRDQFEAEFAGSGEGKSRSTCDVFRGITIHVNGATRPSREELRVLVGERGGGFEAYLTAGVVTHIVCERLAAATRLRFRKMVKSRSVHVVTPAWLVDSAAAGKILPVADYSVPGMTEPGQKSVASFFASNQRGGKGGK